MLKELKENWSDYMDIFHFQSDKLLPQRHQHNNTISSVIPRVEFGEGGVERLFLGSERKPLPVMLIAEQSHQALICAIDEWIQQQISSKVNPLPESIEAIFYITKKWLIGERDDEFITWWRCTGQLGMHLHYSRQHLVPPHNIGNSFTKV